MEIKIIRPSVFLIYLSVFINGLNIANAQESNQLNAERLSSEGIASDNILIGEVNRQGFLSDPYAEWFEANYNYYEPKTDILKEIKPQLKNIEIVVFMGTWCGDSRIQVPEFYKLLDELKFNDKHLKVIALGNAREEYKKSPNGEEKGKNIIRVPTIIVNRKGLEIGRIIEYPVNSLEEDFLTILAGSNYTPQYEIESDVNDYFEKNGVNVFNENIDTLATYFKSKNISKDQLATYVTRILISSKEFEKAIAVLNMMLIIYPETSSYYLVLGKIYDYLGETQMALVNYSKAVKNIENDPIVNGADRSFDELINRTQVNNN